MKCDKFDDFTETSYNREGVDPVEVVEAAYRVDRGDDDWLLGLADALRPALDREFGIAACLYERTGGGPLEVRALAHRGPAAWREALLSALTRRPPDDGGALFGEASCGTLGRRNPALLHRWWPLLELIGLGEVVGIDVRIGGAGCLVVAPARAGLTLSDEETSALSRTAALVESALRLRLRIPSSGTAREALREAACAVDGSAAAREEAAEHWREVVGGRWPVVDRFQRDGRCYLVARRTEAHARAPLSEREREVVTWAARGYPNKRIAWELGISASSVAAHLARAARRLGASSRVALIRLWTDTK